MYLLNNISYSCLFFVFFLPFPISYEKYCYYSHFPFFSFYRPKLYVNDPPAFFNIIIIITIF